MLYYAFIQALFVAVSLVGLVVGIRAGLRLTRERPRVALALLLVVVVSLALRFGFAEAGAIHENYCNVGRATCAGSPPCHSLTGNHSYATFAGYNTLLRVVGFSTERLIRLNGVLGGALHVLLVFALAMALFRRAGPALAAAAALALLPTHIRVSVSDSPTGLSSVLALGLLVALTHYAREGGWARGLLAVALGVLCVQTLKAYGLLGVGAVAYFLLLRPQWRRVPPRQILALVALGLAASAPYLASLFPSASSLPNAYLSSPGDFPRLFARHNLLLDGSFTPTLLIAAFLVGASVSLISGRRGRDGGWPGLALIVSFLSLAVVLLTPDPWDLTYPTRVRMQIMLAPMAAVFMGVGLDAWWRRRGPFRLALVLLGAFSLWQAPAYRSVVGEQLTPAREIHHLVATIPTLPAHDVLVIPDFTLLPRDVQRRGDGAEFHFPELDLRRHHGEGVRVVRRDRAVEAYHELYGLRVLAYKGITYSAWLPEELAANPARPPHRPEWDELLETFEIVAPVAEGAIIDEDPDWVRNHYLVNPIPVGFYWIRPR